VLSVAQDWYLWYDEMAQVNAADFATADELLVALTAPLAEDFRDPGFSYLTTRSEDEANFTSRAFVGFGFRFAVDDSGSYRISDVFEGAPAARAGFRRGSEILAVDAGNGFVSMADYEARGTALDEIFGPSDDGVVRDFRLRNGDEIVDVSVVKEELVIPPLANAPRAIARAGLSPAGYIHLRNFTRSASAALNDAFAELANEDITDFIIDLRFNGGGLVDVADDFMDLLGGRIADGDVAYQLSHNEKRRAENADFLFDLRPDSASPIRIAFITSAATASASEAIINSMASVVEVVLIGSDTSGKAVGQYGFDQSGCDTRLRLVSFETLNGDGLGGYYTGLADTGRFTLCAVEDNFAGDFGTGDDALTAGALAWLNEGVCTVTLSANDSVPAQRGLRQTRPVINAVERPDRRSDWVQ
jgi:C-terminal processing protease CtpA/Prc